jgi:hypothetical protein
MVDGYQLEECTSELWDALKARATSEVGYDFDTGEPIPGVFDQETRDAFKRAVYTRLGHVFVSVRALVSECTEYDVTELQILLWRLLAKMEVLMAFDSGCSSGEHFAMLSHEVLPCVLKLGRFRTGGEPMCRFPDEIRIKRSPDLSIKRITRFRLDLKHDILSMQWGVALRAQGKSPWSG